MARTEPVAPRPPRCLERWVHTDPPDGIPYYDHELDVPHMPPHSAAVREIGAILADIAREAGLVFVSDHPIWYLHPENDEQRVFYGDLVLARPTDTMRITADDLLVVIEVVSTNDRRKELKDLRFQRLLNEYNRVPEFALLFPDLDDPRALTWCTLGGELYGGRDLGPGDAVRSETVPDLELRVRPRDRWEQGLKVDVVYRDEVRAPYGEERRRADDERRRADDERRRADRLATRLRELGEDPDAL